MKKLLYILPKKKVFMIQVSAHEFFDGTSACGKFFHLDYRLNFCSHIFKDHSHKNVMKIMEKKHINKAIKLAKDGEMSIICFMIREIQLNQQQLTMKKSVNFYYNIEKEFLGSKYLK